MVRQDKENRLESGCSRGGGDRKVNTFDIPIVTDRVPLNDLRLDSYSDEEKRAILGKYGISLVKHGRKNGAERSAERAVFSCLEDDAELPDWVIDNRYFLDKDPRACLKLQISESGCFEVFGHENYSGVKYRKLAIDEEEKKTRGDRKEIKEFTRKSRLNFLKRTSDINWKKIPRDRQYMIGLTYEIEAYEKYRNDGRAIKNQLDQFFRELDIFMRSNGVSWSAVWVLEFQKNTHNPHFHMVVILDKNIHSKGRTIWLLREWIKPTWARIIGGSEKSERVGTDVQGIKHSVIGYFAKYCGKEGIQKKRPEGYEGIGRFWGIRGRKALPWLEIVSVLIEYEGGVMVKRLIRQFLRKRGSRKKARGDPRSPLLCFGVDVSNLTRLLEAGGMVDV